VRPLSNVILKVDTIFDSMSNIMYALICPLIWQNTPIKESIKATHVKTPTEEPLRIRIPRFIICLNCEKDKILTINEIIPKAWRCTDCYNKLS
jgi:hypothetical protein